MRWLLLILLGYVLWRFFQRLKLNKPKQSIESTKMIKCAYCATHVPENEAIANQYCCPEHQRQHHS